MKKNRNLHDRDILIQDKISAEKGYENIKNLLKNGEKIDCVIVATYMYALNDIDKKNLFTNNRDLL